MTAGRILVVDDKQRVTQLLGILLEEAGYEVVSETDPRLALEATRGGSFDLVLCDIVMPSMSGYDFCQRLRAHPATARVPLLFVSSKEEREASLTGSIVGGDGFVEKPFDREALLAKVEALLRRGVEQG